MVDLLANNIYQNHIGLKLVTSFDINLRFSDIVKQPVSVVCQQPEETLECQQGPGVSL